MKGISFKLKRDAIFMSSGVQKKRYTDSAFGGKNIGLSVSMPLSRNV